MASTLEYLEYVIDLLSGLDGVSHRKMMGEYVIYCRGKVVGGVYDDRFLLKATESSRRLLPDAHLELPYEGGSRMLLVDIEDRDLLREVVEAMWSELPAPRKKR